MAKREKTPEELAEERRLAALGMRPGDQNETPPDALDAFAGELKRLIVAHSIATILDPFCGRGRLLDAVWGHVVQLDLGYDDRAIALRGCEIDPDLAKQCTPAACWCGDALQRDWLYDGRLLVVTNPPYSRMVECVEHAASQAVVSCMLLPLRFLGSDKRAALNRRLRPAVRVLPWRPSFSGDGGNDYYDSAWFVFGDEATAGTWEVLREPGEAGQQG